MKVKLLKDLNDNKAGESIEVDEARANYLHRVGAINLSKKAESKVENAIPDAEPLGPVVKEEKHPIATKEEKAPKDITTKSVKK